MGCVDIEIVGVVVRMREKGIEGKFVVVGRVEIFGGVEGYDRRV